MNIRDEDILTEIEDLSPSCPDCGISAQWLDCENCKGHGCEPCQGDGGEWYCERCTRNVPVS